MLLLDYYNLDLKKIESPKTFQTVQGAVSDFLFQNEIRSANDLRLMIEKNLKKSELASRDSDLYQKYLAEIVRLKIITLASLSYDEMLDFTKKHFVMALHNKDINIYNKYRVLLLKFDKSFRDDMKKDFIKALQDNKEKIGAKQITVKQGEKPKPPYAKYWLADYNEFLGVGAGRDRLQRNRYLAQSTNARRLSQPERISLHDLLLFYDTLKISSYKVGSLDNPSISTFVPEVAGFDILTTPPPGTKKTKPAAVARPGVSSALPSPVPGPSPRKQPTISESRRPLPAKTSLGGKPSAIPRSPATAPVPTLPKQPDVVDLKNKPSVKPAVKPQQVIPQKPKINLDSISDISKLSVNVLRRIAQDPYRAVGSLKAKIAKFVSISPLDKEQAQNNWRQSELYKLYIAMGQESMEGKKPVAEVSKTRQSQGKPYLSEDEFKAVVELSKMF